MQKFTGNNAAVGMEQHTPEPWDTDGFSSVGATGSDQFNGGYFTANCEGPDKTENARRIVACVNACVDIPNDKLAEVRQVRDELADIDTLEQEVRQMRARLERLECENHELISALVESRNALQMANDTPNGPISDTIWMLHNPETLFDFMDAAIANAKGGAA